MGRVLRTNVHVTLPSLEVVVLRAGTAVPDDLAEFVTNPKAYVDGVAAPIEREAAGDGEPDAETDEQAKAYDELTGDELRDLLKERELPQAGKNAELIERLKADDLEREAAGDGEPDAETDEQD